jgi:hypothetical protein
MNGQTRDSGSIGHKTQNEHKHNKAKTQHRKHIFIIYSHPSL